MYNKNNLMRNVLITAEEVIFHASTKHTLDPRMIEQSIIVAEERFIKPEIGFKLYQDLVDAKNIEITDGNLNTYQPKMLSIPIEAGDMVNAFELLSAPYQKLWKQHLWKLVAECVMVSAYPEGFVQFGAEGTFHNSPPAGLMVTSGFVTPLLSSMKWALDKKIQERVAPLVSSMHMYICTFISDYPLYDKVCPDCEANKTGPSYAGIALDIYDDDNSEDCKCPPGWMKK